MKVSHLLSGVVSGSSQPILALYDSFRVVSHFISGDVPECFDLQIYYEWTSCRFYYKAGQTPLQSGAVLIYEKAGQVLLQTGAGIVNWSNSEQVGQYRK